MKKSMAIASLACVFALPGLAQVSKDKPAVKHVNAVRTDKPPKIDGVVHDI